MRPVIFRVPAIAFVLTAVLFSFAVTHSSSSFSQAFITVPDDYPTITQAMNSAVAGDTIEVLPPVSGDEVVYHENVILKAGVHLMSSDPSSVTIRAASNALPVVRILKANDQYPTILSGFKVTGGSIGVKVDINKADDFNFLSGTEIVIAGNWIVDNENHGIDAYTAESSLGKVQGDLIVNNLISGHSKSGIWLGVVAVVVNNTIDNNGLPGDGEDTKAVGIAITRNNIGSSTIHNNIITNNEGFGIDTFYMEGIFDGNPIGNITHNNIWNNNGAGAGTAGNVNINRSLFSGGTNLIVNPQFNASTDFGYMPSSGSQCIDAGDKELYNAGRFPELLANDLTQSIGGRIYPVGGQVDIGAIEYNPNPHQLPSSTPTSTRTPTPTSTPKPTVGADLNGDGYINGLDMFLMQQQWHSITPTPGP